MHHLKDSWQFSFKITQKATRISFEKPQFICETQYSVVVLSEFAELEKVQRPNLWPDDYSFMRMSR